MEYLRTTLISGALLTESRNLRQGVKEIKLFEIGNVFNKKNEYEIKSFDDFTENQNLLFLISGKEHLKGWNIQEKESDIYNLKGIVDSFLLKLSLDNVLIDSYYSTVNEIFAYYFTKNHNKVEFGLGGKIKKEVLKQFDINQDVYCFEFNLTELKSLNIQNRRFTEPLK
jgi:phenylalanyl-tRNA synthetase beta chain